MDRGRWVVLQDMFCGSVHLLHQSTNVEGGGACFVEGRCVLTARPADLWHFPTSKSYRITTSTSSFAVSRLWRRALFGSPSRRSSRLPSNARPWRKRAACQTATATLSLLPLTRRCPTLPLSKTHTFSCRFCLLHTLHSSNCLRLSLWRDAAPTFHTQSYRQ